MWNQILLSQVLYRRNSSCFH